VSADAEVARLSRTQRHESSTSRVAPHLPAKPCRLFQPNPHQPKLVNRLPSGCLVVRTACRLDRNTQPAGPYQVRVSSAGFRQQSLRGGFDDRMTSSMMPTIERARRKVTLASSLWITSSRCGGCDCDRGAALRISFGYCDNQFAQGEGRLRSERAGQRARRSASRASSQKKLKPKVNDQRARVARSRERKSSGFSPGPRRKATQQIRVRTGPASRRTRFTFPASKPMRATT
jgi:hypothetical protein